MCLIFTHHPDTVLEKEWVANFWYHNGDGIGVMSKAWDADLDMHYIDIVKMMPKTEDEAWQFYEQNIKGRECVVHFRMATHGDCDVTQVHPYVIAETAGRPTMAFMHNGVLACGNSFDRTKSDTWHFNRWYMQPLLSAEDGGHPDMFRKLAFKDLLGTYIGDNNRFVIMDDDGEIVIINEHEGVRWRGMWLANTYAWDAPSHLSKYRRVAGKDEKHTIEQDLKDKPPKGWDDYNDRGWWTNYRDQSKQDFTPPTTIKGTVVGINESRTPSNDTTKVVVASNGVGKELTSVRSTTPFGQRKIKEWLLNQFDGMFDLLKQEHLDKAWAKITYNDLHTFEQEYDLDQLWDAIYMGVDGVITEDRLLDVLLNPKQYWSNEPARQRHLAASVRNDDDIVNPGEEEVIAATLPREPEPLPDGPDLDGHIGPDILPDGRPLFNNKEVF